MSYQSFPKATGSIVDGYVLTFSGADGYWKPQVPPSPVHAFKSLTTDVSTTSSSFSEIMSQNLTLPRDGYVVVMFAVSGVRLVQIGTVKFELKIDGNVEEAGQISTGTGYAFSLSIVYRKQLISGTHTFSIEWAVDTNGAQILAQSDPLQFANLFVEQISGSSTGSGASSAIDSNANFFTIVDNVAGNGSYPSTNATNWTGSYIADGYSKVIIFGSATGGMSGSGNAVTLNLKVDGTTVRSATRFANNNGIHVAFPALFYSAILSAGSHTLALEQSGANSFSNSDSYANLHVYKIANVNNLGWTSTKTGNYSVLSGDTYIPVDTTTSAVTITLPAVPDEGERHLIADVGGNTSANNITINGNGHNIIGLSSYVITAPYNTLEIAYHSGKAIWVII